MTDNIFDLEKFDDLPDAMQTDLIGFSFRDGTASYIMRLFGLTTGALTSDMIRVGLFRKYKIELSRKQLSTSLSHLASKKSFLLVVDGAYSITDAGKIILKLLAEKDDQ